MKIPNTYKEKFIGLQLRRYEGSVGGKYQRKCSIPQTLSSWSEQSSPVLPLSPPTFLPALIATVEAAPTVTIAPAGPLHSTCRGSPGQALGVLCILYTTLLSLTYICTSYDCFSLGKISYVEWTTNIRQGLQREHDIYRRCLAVGDLVTSSSDACAQLLCWPFPSCV
jgi:hypothetical protein